MASSSSLSPDLKIALDAQTAVLVAALDKRFAKLDAEFDRIFAKWLPPIDAKPLVVDAVPTAQIHLVDAVPDAHLDPVAVPNARIDHDDADAGFVAFMTPLLPPTEEIHPVAVPAAHPVAVQGEQIDLDVMPLHHHAARRVTTNTGSPQIHRDAEPPRRVAATTGVTLGKCALGYTADATAPIHRDAARRRSRCFRLQCRRRPPRHWLRRRRRQRQAAEGTYRSLPPQPPAGSRHLVCPGVVRLNASESAASVRNIHEESVTALQVPVLEMFLTDLHVAQSTRVKGICLGIMGNLSCHESLVNAMSLQNGLLATVVYQLFLDDSACPCGTFRLLAAILSCTKSHELLQSILMPSRGCWNSMSKERQQGFLSVRLDVLQDSYRKVDWLSVFTTSDVQSLVKEKGSWCFSDCSIGDGKKYWDTELVGNIQRLNLITLIPGAPPVSISTPAWVDEYKLHGMPSAVVSHGMMNKLLPWYENFYRRPWPPPLWLIEKLSATELYWLWKPPCPSISYAIAVVLAYHVARLLYEVQAYVGSAGCEFTEGTLQRKCGGNCQLFILESFDAWLQCSVNFWWSRITSLHSKRWKLLIASGIRNNIFHPVLCSCAAYGEFYWHWKQPWPPPNLLEFLLDSAMIRAMLWPNFISSAILVGGFKRCKIDNANELSIIASMAQVVGWSINTICGLSAMGILYHKFWQVENSNVRRATVIGLAYVIPSVGVYQVFDGAVQWPPTQLKFKQNGVVQWPKTWMSFSCHEIEGHKVQSSRGVVITFQGLMEAEKATENEKYPDGFLAKYSACIPFSSNAKEVADSYGTDMQFSMGQMEASGTSLVLWFPWDPGGHDTSGLGASRLSRREECQVLWAVGPLLLGYEQGPCHGLLVYLDMEYKKEEAQANGRQSIIKSVINNYCIFSYLLFCYWNHPRETN